MSSLAYALLAMILVGIADAINKSARQASVPIGSYLLVQTSIYTSTILFLALLSGGIQWHSNDVLYGLLAAIFGFAAFVLMLHSLAHGYAGVNYAIFRSSFILSTIAAIILLNEVLSPNKALGTVIACLAIFLFFYKQKHSILSKSLIMAVLAMVASSVFQVILKFSTQATTSELSFILLMSVFFGILVLIYNAALGNFKFPRSTFLLAPVNGLLMALGTYCYFRALRQGELIVVAPIFQLSFVITSLFATILLKEYIDTRKALGIALAAAAIMLFGLL